MKRKVILYIAASIDGFIARADGNMDWLDEVESDGDTGYSEFFSTIDTVIMGNTTYEEILGFDVPFPYPNTKNYVYSYAKTGQNEFVEYVKGDVRELIELLRETSGKHIWLVGGGKLIESFLQHQLIDEIILTIAPIMLGKGIPLFRGMEVETQFRLQDVQQMNQFVQLTYRKRN